MKTIEKTIYEMIKTNTDVVMRDNRGDNDRHWQKNATKTLKDFENEPSVTLNEWNEYYTISLFHFLTSKLAVDELCEKFNNIKNDERVDSGRMYGISKGGIKFLDKNFPWQENEGDIRNSYNRDSNLSQVIQYRYIDFNDKRYVLLQIHNGADVRGGYTDVKLFRAIEDEDTRLETEDVYWLIEYKDGRESLQIDNMYNGYSLTDDNGKEIDLNDENIKSIEVYIVWN